MIITAQPFFNELDLLGLKVHELDGLVDAHIVVESTRTFTGLPKPLHLRDNFDQLGRNSRIIPVVAELPEIAASPWDREAAQYQAVRNAVRLLRPEVCIWCDADEIPRRRAIETFLESNMPIATLVMDHLLFGFDRVDTTQVWRNTKIARYDPNAAEQPWRGTQAPEIFSGGWHCAYFGGRGRLLDKLAGTSHAPEEGCKDMRRRVDAGERPGIERTAKYPFNLLPWVVQKYPERFGDHFVERLAP